MTRSYALTQKLLLASTAAALVCSLFLVTHTVSAHDGDEDGTANTPAGAPTRPPLPGGRPPLAGTAKIGEIKERIQDKLASTSARVKEKIGELRDDREHMLPRMASSTNGQGTTTLRMRFEQEQQKFKERQAARQTELRNKLAQKGQDQYEKVMKRLAAAVLRLTDIADRIDSRISKLTGNGIAMDNAKTLLATARQKIADADAKVKAIPAPTFPNTADASTTPSMINDALKPTRDAAKAAEDALHDAQKALDAVIKEIRAKGGLKADDDGDRHATTTPGGTTL